MATKQLFNANTQQLEDADLSVDANNEIVATFTDGSVLKFPAGLTSDEFDALIAEQQAQNDGQEVITPEMQSAADAERAASYALIGETDPYSQDASQPTE